MAVKPLALREIEKQSKNIYEKTKIYLCKTNKQLLMQNKQNLFCEQKIQ